MEIKSLLFFVLVFVSLTYKFIENPLNNLSVILEILPYIPLLFNGNNKSSGSAFSTKYYFIFLGLIAPILGTLTPILGIEDESNRLSQMLKFSPALFYSITLFIRSNKDFIWAPSLPFITLSVLLNFNFWPYYNSNSIKAFILLATSVLMTLGWISGENAIQIQSNHDFSAFLGSISFIVSYVLLILDSLVKRNVILQIAHKLFYLLSHWLISKILGCPSNPLKNQPNLSSQTKRTDSENENENENGNENGKANERMKDQEKEKEKENENENEQEKEQKEKEIGKNSNTKKDK
ncbi:hypothetical protein M0813_12608 [Anaeramoeba flamelloides]|uniref:Uncharacterized protein n=1 Tax=Anaeramoeba flamelloides TaxID=1746091 RepID=A0ABQ8ZB88_9EUKA|nr:hypothetical protein M0813_12608 [Anaeramoeba flamelloides]